MEESGPVGNDRKDEQERPGWLRKTSISTVWHAGEGGRETSNVTYNTIQHQLHN